MFFFFFIVDAVSIERSFYEDARTPPQSDGQRHSSSLYIAANHKFESERLYGVCTNGATRRTMRSTAGDLHKRRVSDNDSREDGRERESLISKARKRWNNARG